MTASPSQPPTSPVAAGDVEGRLAAIESKLDVLVAQAETTRRRQQELEELKRDLSRIATEAFASVTDELEDLSPHVEAADLLHLVKKLLRNTRNLNQVLDRLESAMDFFDDVAPLQKAAFLELLSTLDEMDRKGTFELLAEARAVLDRVMTSFTVEDVRMLGENIVGILLTIKNFTQPEILSAVNSALSIYQHLDIQAPDDVTFRQLFRDARSPEVKRGLAMGVQFLKNVSTEMQRPADTPPDPRSAAGEAERLRELREPQRPNHAVHDPNEITALQTKNQALRKENRMPVTELARQQIEVDAEGFMVDSTVWNREIAAAIASSEGIGLLTDRHWEVVEFMRREFRDQGTAPSIRRLKKTGGVPTKELYDLFPNGPAKKASKIAGLPKPKGCV